MANPQPKISRSTQWIIILGLAGGAAAYFLLPSDTTTPKHTTTRTTRTSSTANAGLAPGITDEDLKARFDRYKGADHDAFLPLVITKQAIATTNPDPTKPGPGGKGSWTLTGITGSGAWRQAIVENATTNETQFLKTGDVWNGHKVLRVDADSVMLSGAGNQKMQLTFPAPQVDKNGNPIPAPGSAPTPGTPADGTATAAAGAPAAPGAVDPTRAAAPPAATTAAPPAYPGGYGGGRGGYGGGRRGRRGFGGFGGGGF